MQDSIPVTNPVTGEIIGEVAKSSPDDVRLVVQQACIAQKTWGAMPIEQRSRILRKWGDMLWRDRPTAMRVIRDETGKNETGAMLEIIGMDNALNYYVSYGPRILATEKRPPALPVVERGKVYHKPIGVVGFITPWNYPMALVMMDVIPALIAGNAVVIKPSEITPYSTLYAVDLLHRAGVPPHVAQVVTGDGEAGAALVDCVDYVCFTGSTAVGRKVAVQAASRLINYSLELGGKDAMIVLADANIDLAATSALTGALENAGQMCLSVERIYVEGAIYDAFVERVKHYAQQLTIGPGDGFDVHVGSMTNEREITRVEAHIEDAVAKGAQLVWGGKRRPDLGPLFMEPAVLVNVDHTMRVMTEETFGPVIPIMRVRDADEAIRWANDSEYGLSGAIFTADLERAERLALQLDTGDVSINRTAVVVGAPHLPWGGQKNSGIGRRGGPEGLLRFTTTQSMVIDTQVGMNPSLSILDDTTRGFLTALRIIRRVLPFI